MPAQNLNSEELLNLLDKKDRVVIVDFWASWCAPCKALSPIIDDLADKYEGTIDVVKINIMEEQELAQKFNISSIPHLVTFYNGSITNRKSGLNPSNAEEYFESSIKR